MPGQGIHGNGLLERRLQELAEERRRLAMIIDGTAAGTWEWNVQTGEMRVNARWAEIVGYRLEELEPICQKTFLRLVHPDDIALSDAALDDHFQGRSDNYACLLRMRHRNGQWIWIQDRGRVFEWDGQGKPLWMAGAHADVTELQQARQDAAETRQRLQAVVDASDEVAVIATDTDGTITLFNTGAERLLGYSAAEVVGQRRLDAFHDPEELNAWLEPLADAEGNLPDVFEALSARADGQTYSRQWTLLRKEGLPRQVRLSISRMEGADGARIGYVGMAIDITEILQARAEARLSAEKFAGAFTSAALGMALVSLEGRWLDVNDALCRILGYPREELLQVDFQRLTHPDDLQTDLALVQDLLAGRRSHYHLESAISTATAASSGRGCRCRWCAASMASRCTSCRRSRTSPPSAAVSNACSRANSAAASPWMRWPTWCSASTLTAASTMPTRPRYAPWPVMARCRWPGTRCRTCWR